MSHQQLLIRKVIYGVIIIALLIPLSYLSAPATTATANTPAKPGGLLAQMRTEHKLSQANLGEIDPTSEAMKLATLGMRGPAAYLLWQKAWEYKKKENWTGLTAVLEQITHLQPNYESVWIHQAWNLSYNISVEFDDYRDRYYWVIRGIDFLKKGNVYNEDNPALLWETGWVISHKIGRADEHVQFRQLFREDDKFNGNLPVALRDNWLVGKGWFQEGIDSVDIRGADLGKKSPLIYYTNPAKCQMFYGESIETEGTFGEIARFSWEQGGQEWDQYGARDIPTSSGTTVRLGDLEGTRAAAEQLQADFDAMIGDIRETIRQEKLAKLTDIERAAVEVPYEKRDADQREIAAGVAGQDEVSNEEVAERVAESEREKAVDLAQRLTNMARLASQISSYRMTVNYDYWKARCEAEMTADAIQARENIYKGNASFEESDLETARTFFEEGMTRWRAVIDASQILREDGITADDLVEVIKRYKIILKQLDEPMPEDFVLKDFWEEHKPSDYEE